MQENVSIAESLALLNESEQAECLRDLTPDEAIALEHDWKFWARPKQLAPPGNWRIWLLLAGRGFGKTRGVTEWARDKAESMPGSRGAIVSSTAADARDIVVEGESGILAVCPPWNKPKYEPSKRRLTWPNGTVATLYTADEPDRLRGPQHHWALCDELAAWRYIEDAWNMLMMGLRLGDDPQCVVATTPRPIKLLRELLKDPSVVVTRGSTYENRGNLAPAFFNQIIRKYEGTRLGRQELGAEILDDVPGALWTHAKLEENRVQHAPSLMRIVIGVDPAVTANVESSNETGIIVAGIDENEEGYVLDDLSGIYSPGDWAKQVIGAYDKWHADAVVAEVNNGGDLVVSNVRNIAEIMFLKEERLSKEINIKQVRATRGKYVRAEPVAAIDEQGRIHHVGMFAMLEDELCSWIPGEDSPDRLDARVWAFTELLIGDSGMPSDELAKTFGWQG
jgi:phage terminase large subunit-like protein